MPKLLVLTDLADRFSEQASLLDGNSDEKISSLPGCHHKFLDRNESALAKALQQNTRLMLKLKSVWEKSPRQWNKVSMEDFLHCFNLVGKFYNLKYPSISPRIQVMLSGVLTKMVESDKIENLRAKILPLKADGVMGPMTQECLMLYANYKGIDAGDLDIVLTELKKDYLIQK